MLTKQERQYKELRKTLGLPTSALYMRMVQNYDYSNSTESEKRAFIKEMSEGFERGNQ